MKILLLNPHLDATRDLVRTLQEKGIPVLPCTNPQEGWQMLQLHGESVDLAIVHREAANGEADPGMEFVTKFKQDPQYAELPYILSSEKWSDNECAQHQSTADGANAYLTYPWNEAEVFELIEGVTGYSLGAAAPPPPEEYTHVLNLAQAAPAAASVPPPPPAQAKGPPIPPPPPPEATGTAIPRPRAAAAAPPPPSPLATDEASIVMAPPDFGKVEPSQQIATAKVTEPEQSQAIQLDDPEKMDLGPSSHETEEEEHSKFKADVEVPNSDDDGEDSSRLLGSLGKTDYGMEESQVQKEREHSGPRFSPDFKALPVGEAIIPGGASQTPDVETMKKYLSLREQDVASLSNQLKVARDRIKDLEDCLEGEKVARHELEHQVQDEKRRVDGYEDGKKELRDKLEREIEDLQFQIKSRDDKVRRLETQMRDAKEEVDSVKDRVRSDIQKIRTRERELENRLEMARKDSEALLAARENRILELKRKLDLSEFNTDLLQEKFSREQEKASELNERLDKAARAMRVAGGLLDEDEVNEVEDEDENLAQDEVVSSAEEKKEVS